MSLRIASRSLGMYHAIEKNFFEGPVVLWVSVGLNCYRYALWGLFFFLGVVFQDKLNPQF